MPGHKLHPLPIGQRGPLGDHGPFSRGLCAFRQGPPLVSNATDGPPTKLRTNRVKAATAQTELMGDWAHPRWGHRVRWVPLAHRAEQTREEDQRLGLPGNSAKIPHPRSHCASRELSAMSHMADLSEAEPYGPLVTQIGSQGAIDRQELAGVRVWAYPLSTTPLRGIQKPCQRRRAVVSRSLPIGCDTSFGGCLHRLQPRRLVNCFAMLRAALLFSTSVHWKALADTLSAHVPDQVYQLSYLSAQYAPHTRRNE